MGLKRCYNTGSCLEDCPYGKLDFPECVIVKCDDAIAYIQQLGADNAKLNRCIENMTDKLNEVNDEVAELQAERNAAVNELIGTCQVCRWEDTEKCASCHFNPEAWNVHESNWEWRGVQKEEPK